jgi:hypothetical protein
MLLPEFRLRFKNCDFSEVQLLAKIAGSPMIHETFDTDINARLFFDSYDAKAEGLLSSAGEEHIQKNPFICSR